MTKKPVLYRKRYIPNETVKLDKDDVLYFDGNKIITRWKVIKERADFTDGESLYLIDEGFKISRFYKADGELLYVYCDIIDVVPGDKPGEYVAKDLLADVIVYNNGHVKVIDIGEIAEANEKGLISESLVRMALKRLDHLLAIIYGGSLPELLKILDNAAQGRF